MDTTLKIQKELEKCKNNPYYFATTYYKVYDVDGNEHPFATILTEEEFNRFIFFNGTIL